MFPECIDCGREKYELNGICDGCLHRIREDDFNNLVIRKVAIDLLWYFYASGDRPSELWPAAEALRQAVGVSVEDLREQA